MENEGCNNERPCVANAVCTNITNSGEMKCVVQGSLKIGKYSTIDLACETFFTEENKCAEGYKLYQNNTKSPFPYKCPETNKCIYNNSENTIF